MRMQRRNGGDNYWNQRVDWGFFMESPSHSEVFVNDSSSASLMQPLSAVSSGGGASGVGGGGFGRIEHTVSKFDTLAGVAIKYGVEVADIKKMNGLTTDIQMFSRKTLYIPLPGRHPPSLIMSNGHDVQGPRKSEMTPPNRRPAGKGLALRPTAASRTSNDPDGLQNMPPLKLGDSVISDTSNVVKKSSSSPSFHDSYNNSNSNSNNYTSISSILQTSVLSLTADLQALSTAAITRPIFDGLPKPMSGRKNKAAID
ncbi:hypothetical protein L1987_61574 [Smallanthus sonchifolius]|uniref:Uncharacterized protein n=1 Tax=Smallanthus sonchifolius TaxID=185202 RepID=A0ACB9C834_9ASTR|nr:hypothetical protein L1987_61574 [Smallanthus sonchifolius]